MFKKSQVIAAGLIVILLSAAVSVAVSASRPESFMTAGTTRYAAAFSEAATSMSSTTYTNVPGLSTSITIPSGKHADLVIIFCGEARSDGHMLVRAQIGSSSASPSEMQLREYTSSVDFETQCAQFFKTGVGSGTKTVKMQYKAPAFLQVQELGRRSMIVIANIH